MVAERSTDSHADTRLYLIVHNAFRLMTTRFVDATEKLEPSALHPMIRSHWSDYAPCSRRTLRADLKPSNNP